VSSERPSNPPAGGLAPFRPVHALALPLLGILLFLLVWPVFLLAGQSLGGSSGFSLEKYSELFLVPRNRAALLASVLLSALVAVLSTALCLAPAWLLVRSRFRGKKLLRALLSLPLSFSGVIVGFLTVLSFGRAGVVPGILERLTGHAWFSGAAYQGGGLLLAYLYFEIPRATLTLEAALAKIDFRLESAARTLGASAGQCLRWVILPLARPALLSTFAVTWSVSLGSFGVVLILATRNFTLLPLEIFMQYLAFPSDRALAAAMAVTLLGFALGVNLGLRALVARWEGRRGTAPISV